LPDNSARRLSIDESLCPKSKGRKEKE